MWFILWSVTPGDPGDIMSLIGHSVLIITTVYIISGRKITSWLCNVICALVIKMIKPTPPEGALTMHYQMPPVEWVNRWTLVNLIMHPIFAFLCMCLIRCATDCNRQPFSSCLPCSWLAITCWLTLTTPARQMAKHVFNFIPHSDYHISMVWE